VHSPRGEADIDLFQEARLFSSQKDFFVASQAAPGTGRSVLGLGLLGPGRVRPRFQPLNGEDCCHVTWREVDGALVEECIRRHSEFPRGEKASLMICRHLNLAGQEPTGVLTPLTQCSQQFIIARHCFGMVPIEHDKRRQ